MKLSLVTVAAVISVATSSVRAAPTACERDSECLARQFADLLSLEPRIPELAAPHVVEPMPVLDDLRRDSIITFTPYTARVYSAGREKIAAFARSWATHKGWGIITVEGYADARTATADREALAQKRAERVRGYLIRYGVAAEYVVAVAGVSENRTAAARVDLAIEQCDRTAFECTEPR
ncbi:MAG: OmpA family protein [Kofleriaceae bacterium]